MLRVLTAVVVAGDFLDLKIAEVGSCIPTTALNPVYFPHTPPTLHLQHVFRTGQPLLLSRLFHHVTWRPTTPTPTEAPTTTMATAGRGIAGTSSWKSGQQSDDGCADMVN
jgi:hypothetical protein